MFYIFVKKNKIMWPLLIAGTALAGYLGVRNTNRTNYQIASDANKRDLDMWRMQQEYNKPVNQMERFKEAGLNPNLIYTQSNQAGSVPSTHTATMQNEMQGGLSGLGTALSVLSAYNDYQLKRANIDNVNANTELTRQRRNSEWVNTQLLTGREGQQWQENTIRRETMQEQIKYLNEMYKTKGSQFVVELMKEQGLAKKLGIENELLDYQRQVQGSLKDFNMSMSDELWQRLLAKIISKLGINF